MQVTLEQLTAWLHSDEGENLEFKEAKNQFDSTKLVRYCCALANEGGGYLVLGFTDKKPRHVVGSKAYQGTLEKKKHDLLQTLRLRVDANEIHHPDGRVVVFAVPSRPIGTPLKVDRIYWMRSGESLTEMTEEKLREIFDEAGPDFSSEVCPKADMSDLDEQAIEVFRKLWYKKSENPAILQMSQDQLLADAELVDGRPTYAALVLLGSHRALGRHLADAEVVFEWRLQEGAIPSDQRREYRKGFILFFDQLWNEIDARNQVHQYQDGLFRWDIPTFREKVVREAILNAIAHRDYRKSGSVFIKQWPTKMEIVSPGGFPEGITPENIIQKQKPRNRRIAETLARCGFVERSGQGADLMFSLSMKDGKSRPDYSRSDRFDVCLVLDGQVKDESFVRFLEKLGQEKQISWGLEELLVLSNIQEERSISFKELAAVRHLEELGAIERIGRREYILSKRYYSMTNRKGEYTRKRGEGEGPEALLLKHIEENASSGSTLLELQQVLPGHSRNQVQYLIQKLKQAGLIYVTRRTRAAKWYPEPGDDEN